MPKILCTIFDVCFILFYNRHIKCQNDFNKINFFLNIFFFYFVYFFFIWTNNRQLDNFYQKEVRSNDNIMSSPKNLQDCYFYYYSVCRKVIKKEKKILCVRLFYFFSSFFSLSCRAVYCVVLYVGTLSTSSIYTNNFFFLFMNVEHNRERAAHIDMNRLPWVTNVSVQNGQKTNVFNQIALIVIWSSRKHGIISLLFSSIYWQILIYFFFGFISILMQKSNTMLLGE